MSMCAAVLLSLQMVQSGRAWVVLWCLLRGDFLYSGATQRRCNRARLALHVMSSMTVSLPSLLPPGPVHVIVVCVCVCVRVCVLCGVCVCVLCVCVCVLCGVCVCCARVLCVYVCVVWGECVW